MIKFFRQSYIIQYIVLAVLAVALWIPAFVSDSVDLTLTSPVTPIYNWLSGLLDASPLAMMITAFVLMVLGAMFFNSILVANQIIPKVSTMGAFVYLLFMNLTLTQTGFFPFALSQLFILAMIHICYLVYQNSNPEIYLFNAGVCLALATMCYFPSIVLIVWVLISLIVSHFSSLRLHIIPVIGFLFPYFIYFGGTYLFGDLPSVLHDYSDYLANVNLTTVGFRVRYIALLAVLAIFVLLPLVHSENYNFEKSVSVRSKLMMTLSMLLFSILLLFMGGNPLLHGLVFLSLAIVATYDLSYVDKTGPANIVMILFVVLIFLNRYLFKIM